MDLKQILIHRLGGYTQEDMQKREEKWRQEVDRWESRCNKLVNEYGSIETISESVKIDPFALHAYEPKILADMMKNLCSKICERAGRYTERYHSDDYERNLRTVTLSLRVIRNNHF
ncbi:MAG: hypothetical protein J6K73_05400 [Clostridia bacterium]|nr:hypothetical protein [Clostridia bacterium]